MQLEAVPNQSQAAPLAPTPHTPPTLEGAVGGKGARIKSSHLYIGRDDSFSVPKPAAPSNRVWAFFKKRGFLRHPETKKPVAMYVLHREPEFCLVKPEGYPEMNVETCLLDFVDLAALPEEGSFKAKGSRATSHRRQPKRRHIKYREDWGYRKRNASAQADSFDVPEGLDDPDSYAARGETKTIGEGKEKEVDTPRASREYLSTGSNKAAPKATAWTQREGSRAEKGKTSDEELASPASPHSGSMFVEETEHGPQVTYRGSLSTLVNIIRPLAAPATALTHREMQQRLGGARRDKYNGIRLYLARGCSWEKVRKEMGVSRAVTDKWDAWARSKLGNAFMAREAGKRMNGKFVGSVKEPETTRKAA